MPGSQEQPPVLWKYSSRAASAKMIPMIKLPVMFTVKVAQGNEPGFMKWLTRYLPILPILPPSPTSNIFLSWSVDWQVSGRNVFEINAPPAIPSHEFYLHRFFHVRVGIIDDGWGIIKIKVFVDIVGGRFIFDFWFQAACCKMFCKIQIGRCSGCLFSRYCSAVLKSPSRLALMKAVLPVSSAVDFLFLLLQAVYKANSSTARNNFLIIV